MNPSWYHIRDITVTIVEYLDTATTIQTLPLVSRGLYQIYSSNVIWNTLASRQIFLDPLRPFATPLPQIIPQLLKEIKKKPPSSVLAKALATTSTDHASQSLVRTLDVNPLAFWSSTANESPQDAESVVYRVSGELGSLIKSVEVQFYQELRQSKFPKYTTAQLRIRCGVVNQHILDTAPLPLKNDYEITEETDGQWFQWHYTSEWSPCTHSVSKQTYTLPLHIPAQVLRIDFTGMRTKQSDADDLFYVCLNKVVARGVEMSATSVGGSGGRWVDTLHRNGHVAIPASDYGITQIPSQISIDRWELLMDQFNAEIEKQQPSRDELTRIFQEVSQTMFIFQMMVSHGVEEEE
eukprot:PhF_6_TR44168/c0_g1_i4/m.67649